MTTSKEQLAQAITYIKEHSPDGVFWVEEHKKFTTSITIRGCLREAAEMAGVVVGKKTGERLRGNTAKKLVILELENRMLPYQVGSLEHCTTLNELIATHTLKDTQILLNMPQCKSILLQLKESFPFPTITLDTFTWKRLDKLVACKNGNQRKCMVKFIGGEIGMSAFLKGIFFPYMAGFNALNRNGATRGFIKSVEQKSPTPKSLLDHCARMWNMDAKYPNITLLFLTKYKKVPIKDLTYEQIMSFVYEDWKTDMKHWRSAFLTNYIHPLIKEGVLAEDFLDKLSFDKLFRKHIKSREKVEKNKRTVLWYGFEQLRDEQTEKYSIDLDSGAGTKATFCSRFETIKDLRAVDFTKEHQREMRKRGGSSFILAINMMMEDGLCSSDVFDKEDTKEEGFTFEDDKWSFQGISYDFTRFEDHSYKKAIKKFIWHKSEEATRKIKFTQPNLEEMVGILTELGADNLAKVNHDMQKLFHMSLSRMCKIEQETSTARALLKTFRGFTATLKDIDYAELDPSIVTKNDLFSLPQKQIKITTYDESEMQKILEFIKNSEDRLLACAFGLTALLARRIGEIVADKRKICGLKLDALRKIGLSSQYALVYEATKQNKIDFILLSDMVGERTDPFARELIDLSISLFEEALQITKRYRHLVSDELKDYLFIEPKTIGGYGLLRGDRVRTASKKLYSMVGIDTSKNLHTFRHTMATNIILSGGTLADAADALGDAPYTVAKHYHQVTEKIDTLKFFAKMGRSEMVQPLKDSRFFKELQSQQHKVVAPQEMDESAKDVVGGKCIASVNEMINCPSYMMINGEAGCPGCKHYRVDSEANKAFWQTQKRNKLIAMDREEKGSWWFEKTKAEYDQAKKMIEDIEQKELEYEFGI